ncbi:hypothetical protein OEA41_005324 [Lepraria neglecta]|uniref:Ankyrin n=1 Tax=Lepraria neglecta TaxID=209136 RepID=A0AAD9Z0V6_9LECA|nr:hypothetical protein OEA41_005324 [Lepraria neglecta]
MDPLSIITAVVTIVSGAAASYKEITSFIDAISRAPKEVEDIRTDSGNIYNIISNLRDALRDQHRLPRSKACQRPRGAAILTKATLEKVVEKLHEHFRASGRVGELKLRFQWWKARDDFQKLQRQLGQNMATLSLSMAGLNTAEPSSQRDKEAMQDIIRQMQDWQPALIRAAIDVDDMKMACLLGERADPDYVEPLERKAPLHFASEDGQAQIALMLLAHEADVNHVDAIEGKSPLVTASRYGNLQVARTLPDHGADPEAQSDWSWSNCGIRSLLHWAVVGGDFFGHHGKVKHREELLRLLLDRGVDVNAKCCMIHTPLQAAVAAVEDEEDPLAVIQSYCSKRALFSMSATDKVIRRSTMRRARAIGWYESYSILEHLQTA